MAKKKLALRYNQGKLRWQNVPLFLFEDVIRVGQHGEQKYTTYNYMTGFPLTELLDSLKRHLNSFESPYEKDEDPESGINHLASVAWNAIVALNQMKHMKHLDNRYKLTSTSSGKNKIKDARVRATGAKKRSKNPS